jgi:hypothetical protein
MHISRSLEEYPALDKVDSISFTLSSVNLIELMSSPVQVLQNRVFNGSISPSNASYIFPFSNLFKHISNLSVAAVSKLSGLKIEELVF